MDMSTVCLVLAVELRLPLMRSRRVLVRGRQSLRRVHGWFARCEHADAIAEYYKSREWPSQLNLVPLRRE